MHELAVASLFLISTCFFDNLKSINVFTSYQAQVAAIAGTKEAITLFSSAKYLQVPTEQADFVPLFGGKQSEFPIATVSIDAGQHQVWRYWINLSIMNVP